MHHDMGFWFFFFFSKQQVQTDYCFSWLDHQTDDAFPICSSGDNISIFSIWVATWIMKSMIWTCFIFNAHQMWSVSTGRISFLNQETGICSFYVPFIHAILLLKSVCSAVCVLACLACFLKPVNRRTKEYDCWLLIGDQCDCSQCEVNRWCCQREVSDRAPSVV